MITDTRLTTFEYFTCPECGIQTGCDQSYMARLRERKKSFFCLNGHSLSFNPQGDDAIKSKLALVEKQLLAKTRQLEMSEAETEEARRRSDALAKSLASTKSTLERTKKRAAAGVCPCCNRSFEVLHRHMQSQHPDYVAKEEISAETPIIKRGRPLGSKNKQ